FDLPVGVPVFGVFSSVALIFFAYVGFEDIANIAEEVKNPGRNLPRAIIYAIIITTILYIFTSISAVSILPYDVIAASPDPLNAVVTAVLGPAGGVLISVIALFATANTVLIILIVTSRMMYGMARDNALPKSLSKVHVKHGTPYIAVFVTMFLSMILVLFGDISIVAFATVFGVLLTFIVVNLSLIVLRKIEPDKERPFKTWPNIRWVPVTAVFALASCIGLLFTFDPFIILIQIIIIVVGVLFYYSLKKIRLNKTPEQ
ncbi:MAG: APC family permease, partial [Candidatus Odinarchaeia archaeon]